ncbi:methyltransferase domain-containing protein [Desulfobacterota bacterium AH_259_B03_O07]|nr:methyltransferase domain-containing protein [Desulfobacterota bacterium AH_259_B03_O07]
MADQVKRLHLGCALKTPKGWINLNGSWNAWLAKYPIVHKFLKLLHVLPESQLDITWSPYILIHDVRKPIPFQDNSLSAIYASHLLEHLYLEEAKHLLKECFRTLQPGGVLRMVVPDLRAIVLEYMGEKPFGDSSEGMEAISRADRLNERLRLRKPEPPSGKIFYRIYTALKDFRSHKQMYDADSLIMYFKLSGFINVYEMQLHNSRIEEIEKIEEAGRVLNGEGICIEGIKPDFE